MLRPDSTAADFLESHARGGWRRILPATFLAVFLALWAISPQPLPAADASTAVASSTTPNSATASTPASRKFDPSDLAAAAQSISADDLQQVVNYLADDAFEGREAGSRGGRAAGSYIELQLEKKHLHGAAEEGRFFQEFGAGSRNILARLDGSSPELKQQTIIVSAHYDHVGYGKPTNSFGPIGYIHKGADDNASGIAGLLALTEAMGHLPRHPRRSVLFALWDGEEQGLLGSRYWLEHPTVPLAQVPILVNMDMIGRLRSSRVEIYGTRTAPGLRELLSRDNDGLNLLLDFHWEMRADSDHYSFFEHGIPDLLIHTGLHADYHRPSDTADKSSTRRASAK